VLLTLGVGAMREGRRDMTAMIAEATRQLCGAGPLRYTALAPDQSYKLPR